MLRETMAADPVSGTIRGVPCKGREPWLTLIVDNGRIELDNNIVERSIRSIALPEKMRCLQALMGGAEHWAIIASLIETCKIDDVDPLGYHADVPTNISYGHPNGAISTTCCRGHTESKNSRPWPEDDACGSGKSRPGDNSRERL
jgi:hypothetical protein